VRFVVAVIVFQYQNKSLVKKTPFLKCDKSLYFVVVLQSLNYKERK